MNILRRKDRLSVGRIRLEPGDTLVVRSPKPLSHDQVHRILDSTKMLFPDNEVMVLDNGLSLEVVVPKEAVA